MASRRCGRRSVNCSRRPDTGRGNGTRSSTTSPRPGSAPSGSGSSWPAASSRPRTPPTSGSRRRSSSSPTGSRWTRRCALSWPANSTTGRLLPEFLRGMLPAQKDFLGFAPRPRSKRSRRRGTMGIGELMKIGVPREVKNHEYRVAITPAGVHELVRDGHEVFIEAGAGEGSSLPDEDFTAAGAKIFKSADDVWGTADLVLKVKEPVPEEYHQMR